MAASVNSTLFRGARELPLVAVHDESGVYKVDRYFVTGFLFVTELSLPALLADLRAARVAENYWQELHYSKLTEVTGRWGAKFRTARAWAEVLRATMESGSLKAKVLAVDTQAQTYDHTRFAGRRHFAYNRFTRMALETGIRWCYPNEASLRLRLLSDAKGRRPGGDDEDPSVGDNFARYLPRVAGQRIRLEPDWPCVSFVPDEVEEVSPGDEHDACSPECELIQAADLIVSSVAAAIRGPSKKPARFQLAVVAAGWVREGEKPPWLSRIRKSRGFSASMFIPGAALSWPEGLPLVVEPHASQAQGSLFA